MNAEHHDGSTSLLPARRPDDVRITARPHVGVAITRKRSKARLPLREPRVNVLRINWCPDSAAFRSRRRVAVRQEKDPGGENDGESPRKVAMLPSFVEPKVNHGRARKDLNVI
jgi:hypothetical protein